MAFKTEAFVLRARPWQDADRWYDLFTPGEGVISALLRSAAKPGNKLAGHLLPFSRVRVMIGRGKLDHMAGAVTLEDYKEIRGSLRNISLASSVVELFINELSRGNKVAEYELLHSILRFINDSGIPEDKKMILVRVFLWKYLSIAGWQPELSKCMICQKPFTPDWTGKYAHGRGIICLEHSQADSFTVSPKLIEFLKYIINADWPQLVNLQVDKQLNKDWLKASQAYYQAVYERPSQALKLFIYG